MMMGGDCHVVTSAGRPQPAPGALQSVARLVVYSGIRLRRSWKLTLRGLEGLTPITILLRVLLASALVPLPGFHVLAKLLDQVAK